LASATVTLRWAQRPRRPSTQAFARISLDRRIYPLLGNRQLTWGGARCRRRPGRVCRNQRLACRTELPELMMASISEAASAWSSPFPSRRCAASRWAVAASSRIALASATSTTSFSVSERRIDSQMERAARPAVFDPECNGHPDIGNAAGTGVRRWRITGAEEAHPSIANLAFLLPSHGFGPTPAAGRGPARPPRS
jgi:hypothetical protein